MTSRRALALSPVAFTLAVLAAAPAGAQGLRPTGVFVQAGSGAADVQAASIGLLWPWQWRRPLGSGLLTAETELSLSQWRADRGGGHQTLNELVLLPLLRWRPAAGQSPWFVEGGIGLSYADQLLATPQKTFSTRWNFSDNLAVGRSFGAQQQHEISLRLQHTSNAGLREPNPGLNLWMLRYSARF